MKSRLVRRPHDGAPGVSEAQCGLDEGGPGTVMYAWMSSSRETVGELTGKQVALVVRFTQGCKHDRVTSPPWGQSKVDTDIISVVYRLSYYFTER
jgi:hypothetical protein